MQPDTLTRLRNAFAQAALDMLNEPALPVVPRLSQPPFSSMTAGDWREAVRLWRREAEELLNAVPVRACPACGGAASRFLFVSYDLHPFHECDSCGCWFVPKRVDSALFERLFDRSEEARDLAAHMMSARNRDELRDADMTRIGGYLDDVLPLLPARHGGPRRYLDAGCGVGHSLRAGLERGMVVQGVEVDATAVRLARTDGLPVATLSDPLPPGPYDLVSFWETLEHIVDPLQALTALLPHLAEDGLVAITVPNLGSPATKILRESCSWVHGGYNTPGHINLFHLDALRHLLSRAGLTVLSAEGQYSDDPVELTAYLAGETRGAFDALAPPEHPGGLSKSVTDALIAAWPGVALVERLTLASPILRVVACRRGREPEFANMLAQRHEASRQAFVREAHALLAAEPDYKQIAATLQREINLRDRTLAALQQDVAVLQSKYGHTLAGRLERARGRGRFSFLKSIFHHRNRN